MDGIHKNIRGGKGYKKKKTNRVRSRVTKDYSVDVKGGEGYYATVKNIIMDNQVRVITHNNEEITVTFPGRMRRKQWIRQGDIVQINNGLEITRIVRDNDVDKREALEMIKKTEKKNHLFTTVDETSSSDDDDVDDGEYANDNRVAAQGEPDFGSSSSDDEEQKSKKVVNIDDI
jgi:translation initiation factor IF-1